MTVALPEFTVGDLFEAGVHFGHRVSRWNPKMAPYIYEKRNGIYIIDLRSTYGLLRAALVAVFRVSKQNGRILFVGTKSTTSDLVAEYAKRCGQHYVNHRWLGGTLTNWKTVSRSIKKLESVEKLLADLDVMATYTKKEVLGLERTYEKLLRAFGGIRKMRRAPDLLVVLDAVGDDIAVQEGKKLGIPIVAILDTNANPDNIDYPVPGNDDAIRSVKMYLKLFSDSVLAGIEADLNKEFKSDINLTENEIEENLYSHNQEGLDKDLSKIQSENKN